MVLARCLAACLLACCLAIEWTRAANFTSGTQVATKFGVHEIVLTGDAQVTNPFDTLAIVRFTPPSGRANAKSVWAFYDGENTWRARVYLTEVGEWTWDSTCETDSGLHLKSGKFQCESSKLRGRLLTHANNPRQWMTEDGNWFLNLNDTAYFLLCSRDGNGDPVSDEDALRYVADDSSRGISSVRCFLASNESGFVEATQQWSSWFFVDATQDRFRLDNFQCADRRLQMLLNSHPNIAVQVIMFPLEGYKRDTQFWTAMTTAQRQRLLRNLLARFASYPQLLWLFTNDAHYGETFPNNNAMAREVGAFLQQHDLWQHPRSTGHARQVPFFFAAEEWASYIHIEHEHDLGAQQYAQYHEFAKPVFLGEDRYEQDHGPSRDPRHMRYWQRRLFWSWLLSGGSTNYGGRWWVVHPYSETGMRVTSFHKRPNVTFSSSLTGLDSCAAIRNYFEQRGIDLANFEPDHTLVRDHKVTESSRSPKLMRRGQQEFLIYHPNTMADGKEARAGSTSPTIVLDLSKASGEFAVEWYRAEDGLSHASEPISGGGTRELVSPWIGHDCVLRLLGG